MAQFRGEDVPERRFASEPTKGEPAPSPQEQLQMFLQAHCAQPDYEAMEFTMTMGDWRRLFRCT